MVMKPVDPEELLNELQSLPKGFVEVLKKAAEEANIKRIAIIGGVVRDNIINKIHKEAIHEYQDIDAVIEGSIETFVEELKKQFEIERINILQIGNPYKTIRLTIDGMILDIASARVEEYRLPGENPQVFKCGLEKDLSRRDFSVNAIGIELFSKKLIDIYQGCNDISQRKLAFLHSQSVAEDPTRIIRGARYASRLNFNLDPKSLEQIQTTINYWPWHWQAGDPPEKAPAALATRLRMELEILFKKEKWEKALKYLQNWGALKLLEEGLQDDFYWEKRINCSIKLGVEPLTAFIVGAKDPSYLAKRLQIAENQQACITKSNEIIKQVSSVLKAKEYLTWPPSKWCELIEDANWDSYSICIAISRGMPLWRTFFKWHKKWRLVKSKISAKQLLGEGWEQGPKLGEELKRLRNIELDKYIKNSINQN